MTSNGISKHINSKGGSLLDHVTHAPNLLRRAPEPTPAEPRCERVTITPELAARWVHDDVNRDNRVVSKARVKSYASDIKHGRWRFNTQGISFGTDGTLLDGQHRLLAVIESQKMIEMVVWFDVPTGTREVIDIGRTRSLGDIGKLTKLQAAVCVSTMRGINPSPVRQTMAERLTFYHSHATEIDYVISRFPTMIRGVTQASVLGAIVRATLHMSSDDIDQFCEILRTGIGRPNTRDASVIKLRDRLLLSKSGMGRASQVGFCSMTMASLRAFGEGRILTKLYQIDVDPFPLPTSTVGE